MGEITLDGVKIEFTSPAASGTDATARINDVGKGVNHSRVDLEALGTSYECCKLEATSNIMFSSDIVVTCPVDNKDKLAGLSIGFVQTVWFSDRCAAYPIGNTGQYKKFMDVVDFPIKDGEGKP